MKQSLKIFLVSICITLLHYACLYASEDIEKLHYLTENIHPYNYIENDELKGLAVDLLKLIWQELSVKPAKIEVYPWARAYKMLQLNKNTVLFSTAKTKERADKFKWVCPITISSGTAFISLKSNHIEIKSLGEAKQYNIGTIRNDAAEQFLLSKGFNYDQISPVSNFSQNINKLNVGRIDLFAYNDQSFYTTLEKKGIRHDEYETVFIAEKFEPCYAFSQDVSDEVIQKFQYALDKIKKTSEYKKLLKEYVE